MWHAGSAASELAGLARTSTASDLDAITSGYGDVAADAALHRLIAWHTVAQATGQLAWLVKSGQTAELAQPAAALRCALTTITS